MEQKLSFSPVDAADDQPRIGGASFLPTSLNWPTNPDGALLVLICSLPSSLLNQEFGLLYPVNSYISVFTTYSKNDYFLDLITYAGDQQELDQLQAGYTKVLLHERGEARNDSEFLIPASRLQFEPMPIASADFSGSKFSGQPVWLQRLAQTPLGYQFVLQLYSSDFSEGFTDIFYLTDSVGYLTVNPQTSINSEAGLFFTQAT